MKYTFAIIIQVLWLTCALQAQSADILGVAVVHNSRTESSQLETIPNVVVWTDSATQGVSGSNGVFTVAFRPSRRNTQADLQCRHSMYVVANVFQLFNVLIGTDDTLYISMALPQDLVNAQLEIYGQSLPAIRAERDRLLAMLSQGKKEQSEAIRQINRDFNVKLADVEAARKLLEDRVAQLEMQLWEFSKTIAAINLDFADENLVHAYDLCRQGRPLEALGLLGAPKVAAIEKETIDLYRRRKSQMELALLEIPQLRRRLIEFANGHAISAQIHVSMLSLREAAKDYERILEIRKLLVADGDDIAIAEALESLGQIFAAMGKFNQSDSCFGLSRSIKTQVLGPDHPLLAPTWSKIGMLKMDLGLYQEAASAIEKAISLVSHHLINQSGNPLRRDYEYQLADVLIAKGDFEGALLLQKKILNGIKSTQEPTIGSLAHANLKVSQVLEAKGDHEEALRFKALAISLDARPWLCAWNWPTELRSESNALRAENPITIVPTLLQAQIHQFRESRDTLSPMLAELYDQLAMCYSEAGSYDFALIQELKSLAILRRLFAQPHALLALATYHYSLILFRQGNLVDALSAVEAAIQSQVLVLSDNHPDLASSYQLQGEIYFGMKSYAKAKDACKHAIRTRTVGDTKNKLDQCYTMWTLGRIYYQIDSLGPAVACMLQALVQAEEDRNRSAEFIAVTKAALAYIYFEQAEEFFLQKDTIHALEHYQSAAATCPSNPTLRYRIGKCQYLRGEHRAAMNSFNEALELDSAYYPTYLDHIALTAIKAGRFREAKSYLAKYASILPESRSPWRVWLLWDLARRNQSEAIKHLEKLQSLGYDDWNWFELQNGIPGHPYEHDFFNKIKSMASISTNANR